MYYTDAPNDHGTINADGSVTIAFSGPNDNGAVVSYGTWRFATAYHGRALNPAPHIDNITPASVPASSPEVTVLVNGLSFMPGSAVSMGDAQLNTTYVSAEQLRVIIPAALLTSGGVSEMLVTNPGPGGGTYYYPFGIEYPIPVITAITPDTVQGGIGLSTVTVTGRNFAAGAVVTLNGIKEAATRFTSSTSLSVPIYPGDIAKAGVFQIVVVNPPPGGGPSTPFPLTVTGGFHVIAGAIAQNMARLLVGDDRDCVGQSRYTHCLQRVVPDAFGRNRRQPVRFTYGRP